ncbi:MAG: IS200/IS605 family transposase [Bacteroidetes bacterium]|nr:MAG: IS200/IS605 family transposase [Bacteroidota bacterium]
MANTYSQLYVQIVFTVQGKENLIHESIREKIEKYICGIISNNRSKPIAIYCNPDHVHVLIGIHPSISISDMARDIKSSSSKWINENKWIKGKFRWQEGFGGFTYSKSQIDSVAKYILYQPEHHKTSSFKDEYLKLLQELDIKYDDRYLFEWYN